MNIKSPGIYVMRNGVKAYVNQVSQLHCEVSGWWIPQDSDDPTPEPVLTAWGLDGGHGDDDDFDIVDVEVIGTSGTRPLPPVYVLCRFFFMNGKTLMSREKYREAGSRAGSMYKYATVPKYGVFKTSRIAFAIIHGEPPPVDMIVDHINHDRSNNGKRNLRLVTWADNSKNRSKTLRNSTGAVGVRKERSGNWTAFGHEGGKYVHIKTYADYDLAALAAKQWRAARGYHENHGD